MSLTSLVVTGVLPDLAASRTPLADSAAIFLGAAGALMVAIGSAVSMTGNNMGQILNGSRTLFALAENGDLPKWFAQGASRLPDAVERHPVHGGGGADAGADRIVRRPGRGQRDRAPGDVPRRVRIDAGAAKARSRDRRAGGLAFLGHGWRGRAGEVHGAAGTGGADSRVGRRAWHSRRRQPGPVDRGRRRPRRRRRAVLRRHAAEECSGRGFSRTIALLDQRSPSRSRSRESGPVPA